MARSDRCARHDGRDDAGFTVMELVVSSLVLMIALAIFMGGLASMQRTSAYQAGRMRALDDLRITAGTFAKDARHATEVVSATADEVVMTTYVNGALKNVTYQVVGPATDRNLLRTVDTGSRLFVIKLTDASIFAFDNPEPGLVRRIELHMETKPNPQYPAVVLATEVSLRNVT